MGFRKIPTIYTLTEFKDAPGLVVRMKGLKFGQLLKLMTAKDDDGGSVEEMYEIFLKGLISWNLEDEDGIPVPCTAEAVADQELNFVLGIIDVWTTLLTGVSEDLGKDSQSGEKFLGQPVTMEAL